MTKHLDKTPHIGTEPQEPRSYVVRVYRTLRGGMVGQVEDVQTGLIHTFRSAKELWQAVGGRIGGAKPRGEGSQQ